MDIYSEDFEPACRERIQQTRRLLSGMPITSENLHGWVGLSGASYGALGGMALGLLFPDMSYAFLITGGIGAFFGFASGLYFHQEKAKKQDTQKMTVQEINLVRKSETDPLKEEYLSLMSELTSMRSFQDMSVEMSIRNAIRDIGSGIAKLPGQPADDLLRDADIFQKEASRLAAEATQENDPVIAASLQRQSGAQSQRGDSVSRNSVLARRNQVLRHEMGEHIKALKTMLSTTTLGDSSDGYDLAALAQNIQQVAIEAKSLTEAKLELAAVLEEGQDGRKSITLEQPEYRRVVGQ